MVERKIATGLAAVMLCGTLACGDNGTEAAAEVGSVEAAPTESGAARSPAYDPQEPLEPVAVNPKIRELAEAVVAGCQVDEQRAVVTKCTGDEMKSAERWFRDNKPADGAESLSELALTADPPVAAAAAVLWSRFTSSGNQEVRRANATAPASARALRLLASGTFAPTVAKAATYTATLGGRTQHLLDVLEVAPERVRRLGYRNVMSYARLDALPRLQAAAETAQSPKILSAVLEAPLNLFEATDAERAQVCPWGESYLGHESLEVAATAGKVMVRCRGESIDALLAEAERRVAAGQYARPFSQVLREPCFSMMKGVVDPAAQEAQCERVYAFLESVGNNESVDPEERGRALWNIYYQRRDADTLALLRKYEDHPLPEVREQVGKAIKSLVEKYDLGA